MTPPYTKTHSLPTADKRIDVNAEARISAKK